jgi:hypothetical protein
LHHYDPQQTNDNVGALEETTEEFMEDPMGGIGGYGGLGYGGLGGEYGGYGGGLHKFMNPVPDP